MVSRPILGSPSCRALALALALAAIACKSKEPAQASTAERSATPSGATPAAVAERGTGDVPATGSLDPARAPALAGKLLEEGQPAPDVSATAHDGKTVKLSDYRGRPVVVYFYPKDDTPGCTVEAQELRDEFKELGKYQTVVLGVSTDDAESHQAFAAKYNLPFLLLPDSDHTIARAFGVPVTQGRAKRVTFVIDKQGKIARVFPEVTPKGHAQEIVQTVSTLSS